jgi:pimeloyl-ACP methyl ester carboxylesterase
MSTLVLLPGLDGSGELFDAFIRALPGDVATRVLAYPAREMGVQELVDYVQERLPEGEIVLLAESFSGLVALGLLSQTQRPFKAVIFCAAFACSPRPWLVPLAKRLSLSKRLLRLAPDVVLKRWCLGRDATAALLRHFRDVVQRLPARIISHRLGLIQRFRPPRSLNIPCFYLQAVDDRLVPEHAADWFQEHCAPFDLRRVRGPHFLLQANPQACAAQVADILQGLCVAKD